MKGWIRAVVVICACATIVPTGQAVGSSGGTRGAPANPSPDSRLARLDLRATVASEEQFAPLRAIAAAEGSVRVIVGLRILFRAEGALDGAGVRQQRAQIRSAGDRVIAALRGTGYRVTGRFRFTPSIALELSPEALDAVERSGSAGRIQEDEAYSPTLASSTKVIEATETASVGWDGTGQTIAILDTGIQKTHKFLRNVTGGSKVVGEACYSGGGDCPGGGTQSTAAGSGVNCTYAVSGCRHGTHVAGIAAGRGGTGTGTTMNGVAPGASLYSIQVYSRFDGVDCSDAGEDPCALSFVSDQVKGLERVFAVRSSFNFAAVNMGLGAGNFPDPCDSEAQKPAIDNLRSVGIATVVPSGNDGFTGAVNSPGCISTAITVGSTNDQDTVSLFSNSATMVDFFAPGESITSSVPTGTGPGGTDFDVFDGTSMSTPHVAGAWAVVKDALGTGGTVTQIEATFDDTGKPVTDGFANPPITRSRIKVLSAAAWLTDSGFKGAFNLTGPGVNVRSNGTGLAKRANGPFSSQITISQVPVGSRVRKVFLYWMTLGGPDASATFEDSPVQGTLVGASGNPCWDVPSLVGVVRVYRATLPNSSVPGNGTYDIRGVGGTTEVDGTGASLVVVVDRPSSPETGVVRIRDGAFTLAEPGEMATHTFPGLSVPVNPTALRLNVGVGDGQAGRELWMRFRSEKVTDLKPFSGTDGKMWDDLTVVMPTTLLPAGTTNASNSITTATTNHDCLSWAYSALSYRYP